jgi:hypothetical protein
MMPLAEIFEESKVEHTQLSKKEGYKIHHEWLELFARKLMDSSGKFKIGNYVWEAYWSGLLPSIDGDEASRLYRSKPIEDYYVIYENGRTVFDCRSISWPNFFRNEVIVFPKSKLWSMVYSHEETVHYVEPET